MRAILTATMTLFVSSVFLTPTKNPVSLPPPPLFLLPTGSQPDEEEHTEPVEADAHDRHVGPEVVVVLGAQHSQASHDERHRVMCRVPAFPLLGNAACGILQSWAKVAFPVQVAKGGGFVRNSASLSVPLLPRASEGWRSRGFERHFASSGRCARQCITDIPLARTTILRQTISRRNKIVAPHQCRHGRRAIRRIRINLFPHSMRRKQAEGAREQVRLVRSRSLLVATCTYR